MDDILASPPQYLRAPKSTGGELRIDPKGGYRKQGIIRGVSAIAKGEALGHDMWIDDVMLQQTADTINNHSKGVKSRFTHPSLSGDGLGKFVGRMRDAAVVDDKVTADQHFVEAGHKSPDGDLAGYLMDLAREDPESYGLSIVFGVDVGEMDRFEADNEDADGNFSSPDTLNTKNLPHARLSELRAVDAVDEPAANPDGLFHRDQEIAEEAEAMAAYALGLKTNLPKHASLGLDPDRVRGFVCRFLDNHNLEIGAKKMADEITTNEVEEDTPAVEENATEPVNDIADAGEQLQTEAPQEEIADERSGQDFLDRFGDLGGVWFAQGKGWDECVELHEQKLQERIAELETQLTSQAAGELDPIGFTPEQEKGKPGGLIGKIRMPGTQS